MYLSHAQYTHLVAMQPIFFITICYVTKFEVLNINCVLSPQKICDNNLTKKEKRKRKNDDEIWPAESIAEWEEKWKGSEIRIKI